MTNVRCLSQIDSLAEPFGGYQNRQGYRLRQTEEDEGVPLDRMQPRSLLVPPGIPEFLSRDRTVGAGEVLVEGRGWAGPRAGHPGALCVIGGSPRAPAPPRP